MCYVKCMCMHVHPIQLPKQGDENVATMIIICKRGIDDLPCRDLYTSCEETLGSVTHMNGRTLSILGSHDLLEVWVFFQLLRNRKWESEDVV